MNLGCNGKSRTLKIQRIRILHLNLVPLYSTHHVMWCYILCNHLYVQSYECRRLGDRFREHLRNVERNDKDASKPVAIHFSLPNHSKQHMAVCGLSLHLGISESRKTLEQKFIFQIGILNSHGINERFSFN